MRTILTLMRKDFANFFRDRTAVTLTFLIPIVLIYIFGFVFGVNRKDSGPNGIRLAVVNESSNPVAKKIVDSLSQDKAFHVVTKTEDGQPERLLTEADLRPLMRRDEFRYAVILPKDLLAETGIGVHLKIFSNPRNEIENQTVQGLLQRNLFASAPELLGQSLQASARQFIGDARLQKFNDQLATAIANTFGGDKEAIQQRIASGNFGFGNLGGSSSSSSGGGAADFVSRLIHIDTEQVVGQQVKNPGATRVVGGWAVMFLLFALSASAAAFFNEKKAGLFIRLLSAPVHRSQLLWSRFGFGVILGLFQLTMLFFAGYLLYGIDLFSNFVNLLLVCLAAAMACTAVGMLLASLSPSAEAAQGLSSFVILVMSATGGAWFPVSFMPEFMQHVAKFTVVYWAMEGFAEVLWSHLSFVDLLPTLGVLLGISAGVMALAIWFFKRRRLFE